MQFRRIIALASAVAWMGLIGCDSPDADADSDTDTDSGSEATGDPPPGDPGTADDGPEPGEDDGADSADDGGDGDSDPGEDDSGSDDGVPPELSDCCEPRDEPSCSDEEAALCVCDEMTACCVTGWTQECADLAAGLCGACDGGEDDGGSGSDCSETHTLELGAAEAQLSGGWWLTQSSVGEGEILTIDFPYEQDAVVWDVDIPCDDTWHIWVRHFEEQDFDSYFVRLDGEPLERAVFEADCTPAGNGYGWKELNQRDDFAPPCTYTEDPWAPEWTTGAHQVEFSYRESRAIARLVITNDAAHTP